MLDLYESHTKRGGDQPHQEHLAEERADVYESAVYLSSIPAFFFKDPKARFLLLLKRVKASTKLPLECG